MFYTMMHNAYHTAQCALYTVSKKLHFDGMKSLKNDMKSFKKRSDRE